MSKVSALVLVLSLVVVSGCQLNTGSSGSFVSYNVQMASLNATAQIATAAALDSSSQPTARIEQTKKIVAEIRTFVKQGTVGELTRAELVAQLNKIVPIEYQVYTATIMGALSGVSVDTDVIGSNNVARITEVLDGIEERCNKYVAGRAMVSIDGKTQTRFVIEIADPTK